MCCNVFFWKLSYYYFQPTRPHIYICHVNGVQMPASSQRWFFYRKYNFICIFPQITTCSANSSCSVWLNRIPAKLISRFESQRYPPTLRHIDKFITTKYLPLIIEMFQLRKFWKHWKDMIVLNVIIEYQNCNHNTFVAYKASKIDLGEQRTAIWEEQWEI